MRKIIFLVLILINSLGSGLSVAQAEKLRIVATLSTFAALTEEIAGERAVVTYIAAPRFDPHFIEPRPSHVLQVKRADIFVHGGLDLEAWQDPLLNAAGRPDFKAGGENQIDLSLNISLLEVPERALTRAEGDIHLFGNPHYWLDPRNGAIMVTNIAKALSRLDPNGAPVYAARLADFKERLDARLHGWQELLKPYRGMELVAYHNSWVYLTEFVGLKVEKFLEPKPGIPPTPRQLAFLRDYIPKNAVRALIAESYAYRQPLEQLSRDTGRPLLSLCQNVGELSACGDYLGTIDFNLRSLAELLGS